jgi:hypothetical protein
VRTAARPGATRIVARPLMPEGGIRISGSAQYAFVAAPIFFFTECENVRRAAPNGRQLGNMAVGTFDAVEVGGA